MALHQIKSLTFRPKGLSDAIDGSNTFPGALQVCQNLVPLPSTRSVMTGRPGAVQKTDFSGLDAATKGAVNALLVVGNIAYGMIAETSGTYAGLDVPFVYNYITNAFLPVAIPGGTASLPTTPAATGDWTPPIMAQIGTRIVVTHPGFPGGTGPYFGWLDISGFTDNTVTGSTHSNTTIDTLSTDVLTNGWQVGMAITGTDIPANTTIKSIAANGLSLVLSQAATGSHSAITFTVAGGTGTAPLWSSGNTNGNPLIAVPVSVAQFYGRAYYAVLNAVVASDSGAATQVTNATQVLTFQNGLNVTALAGLPLSSPITGGIIQALMAFQGDAIIQQITGDFATSTIAINALNVGTGTLSPLSIAPTPLGLMFLSPHGVFIISFAAQMVGPLGANGQGVQVPFLETINPSRAAGSFNNNVYRISVKNGSVAGTPTEEYWYDITQQIWTGPHTFPAAQIQPAQGANNSFLMAATGINGKLWQSDVVPTAESSVMENGGVINYQLETVLLPDNEQGAMNALIEATLACNLGTSTAVTLILRDETNEVLDTLLLNGNPGSASLWGTMVWGVDPWLGAATYFEQISLDWHEPIIFKQMTLTLSGQVVNNLALGNIYMNYEILGFMLQRAS